MGRKTNKILSIIIGSLNTDIIAAGVSTLLGPGELTFSGTAQIGPGGKSRNIAQMLASYIGKGKVAMIGRTVKDPFHLWSVPFNSLRKYGVNTSFITIDSYKKTKKLPGLALIPVDTEGNNQIYVLPGVNNDFLPEQLEKCSELFQSVGSNGGYMGITLELPLDTAAHALTLAKNFGVKTVLDPGGIDARTDYTDLLNRNLYLIKPNEHEAELLTGIKITGLDAAKDAALKLFRYGIQHVLITHGEKGSYLISGDSAAHIPVPVIDKDIIDTTGCGDQVTSTLIAELINKNSLSAAAESAVAAGTIQATRLGIQPVESSELKRFMKETK